MSTVFSRNKEKRPRSSTSTTNNSFVKNVTSRMSGLLPATITKWFSSPSSSNANGSAPAADITDSSTEDEATDGPASSQPPAKRMRFSTPGNLDGFGTTDGNSMAKTIEPKDSSTLPYNTVQSPPGRNTFRRETNFVSTPIRANEESVVERGEKDTPLFKTQHVVSGIGQSVATKRKSLFDALNTSDSLKVKPTLNISRDPKQPCFKPALSGSPFYHGRTMYGGAASSYINQPNIKQRKVAYVNESNTSDTATMSQSARRIMDLLENYSSPLTEAKRIPQYVKPPRTVESSKTYPETSQNNKVNPYKMQELHPPGIASILRLKQKSRLMDTTSAARQLIASYSSASEYNPYPSSSNNTQKENNSKETNSNLTTKVKSRVTRQLRGDSVNEAPPPPVQLPNAVLQIDSLPKFTLEKPPAAPVFTTGATSTTTTSTCAKKTGSSAAISSVFSIPYYITMSPTSTRSSKTGITSNSRLFKFSSPVKVSSEAAGNCKTPPKFTFGSPDRSIDRPKVDDKKVDSSVVVGSVKETAKSVDNTKDWKCSECWVPNKPNVDKCVSCGNKRETATVDEPAKCTICKLANSQPHLNKCVNCEKMQSKTTGLEALKPGDTSQWKCSVCLVGNDENLAKCICCGASNPKKSNNVAESSEDIWKCFICWITNKNNESSCSCCGTSRNFASFNKPAKCSVCMLADSQPHTNKCVNCDKMQPKTRVFGATKPVDKPQWKCADCWVSNEETAEKCVCCGAANPKKLSVGATTENNVNSTDGKDWKCNECWITNKSHVDKCDACGNAKLETKSSSVHQFGLTVSSSHKPSDDVFKNIVTSQKGSKWECSSCLVKNDDDKTICVCCSSDREHKTEGSGLKSFNFGQNTNTTFKFGINTNFQNANVAKMDHTSMGEELVVDECETNNNVLDKTPTFTFILPTKKSEGNVNLTKENKTVAPKSNFSFGIPKQTIEVPIINKVLEHTKVVEEKQNVHEVPKIDVTSSIQNQIKPLPALFTPPTANTATPPTTNTSSPPPEVLALLGSEKKDIAANSSTSLSVTTSAQESQPQNKFTFPVSGIKASLNIFSAPVSSTPSVVSTTPALFASSLQTVVTTTAAPPVPLFQKPENATTSTVTMFKDPAATSTVSFFQNSEPVATTAPPPTTATKSFFNFSTKTPTTTQSSVEKSKFHFSFGSSNKSETSAVFKPPFGSLGDNSSNTNKFALPSANILSGANGLSTNPLGGANGLSTGSPLTGSISTTGNMLGASNELAANPLSGGNGLQSGTAIPGSLFGAPVLKENMWSSNNNNNNNNNNTTSTNIFVSNTSTNILPKPAAFAFGSSSPFNSANSASTFGGNTQPSQNIFGIANQNSGTQPTLFSNPGPNQSTPAVFGSPTPASNPPPSMGLFGTATATATPTFGAHNQSIPSFDAPSLTPTPGAAFNFGTPQSSPVFGFGQQQQQQQQQQQTQQPQQAGVYSFGVTGGQPQQVQFTMGSGPNTTQRRVRKAVRRNPQR